MRINIPGFPGRPDLPKRRIDITFTNRIAAVLLLLGTAGAAQAQLGRQQGLLEVNTATVEQLSSVPHVTPAIATVLIAQRPFLNITAVDRLLGQSLNEGQRRDVYEKLFLHLNLNSATEEELLLIPNMGERMVHEFLEYRPYTSLAQFRREIGKYVDDREVARLEQYVFVPVNLNTASDEHILSIPGLGRRMLHEFKEYRPYRNMAQFRREIGKYVDEREVARLERYVTQ